MLAAALAQVDEVLADRFDAPPDATLDAFLSGANLPRLFAETADNHAALAELATLSYPHPHGFDKVVLAAPGDDAYKVVLHAWWPERVCDVQAENVHDHRWTFATALLAGGYSFVLYAPGAAGDARTQRYQEYRYSSPGVGQSYGFEYVGDALLRESDPRAVGKGDRYILDSTALHRIDAPRGRTTITLFVQGRPTRETTRVFTRARLAREGSVAVRRFTPEELAERLRRVAAVVGGQAK